MNDKNKTEGFSYSYSACEQQEIRAIREKYAPPVECEDKMERLRRLDASATNKGTVLSLICGVLGALLLGMGMSLVMTELGAALGLWVMPLGIGVGAIGIALIGAAYPIYTRVTKRERERIGPEILRLTDELMK